MKLFLIYIVGVFFCYLLEVLIVAFAGRGLNIKAFLLLPGPALVNHLAEGECEADELIGVMAILLRAEIIWSWATVVAILLIASVGLTRGIARQRRRRVSKRTLS